MSGSELLVPALRDDGTMGRSMSPLLAPSGRGGQRRWQAAGFAGAREAFLPLSLELLKGRPGIPRLEQQVSRLHTRCKFAHTPAEAQLGLGTGECMDAAHTGGLGSLYQPHHCCQGPTEVPSALTLTQHMPIAPHSGAPTSRPCATHRHAQPSPALQDMAPQMPWRRGKAAALHLLPGPPSSVSHPLPSRPSAWHLRALRRGRSGGSGWAVLTVGQLFRGRRGHVSEGAVAGLFSSPSPS